MARRAVQSIVTSIYIYIDCFIFISAGTIWFLAAFLLVVSVSSTVAEHETSREMEKSERDEKVIPIFQVVKFPVSLPEISHSINILIT